MPEKILGPARTERGDIGFRPMLLAGIAMLLALAAMVGLAAWLYPATLRERRTALPPPPFADPVLQPNTAADMARFRAEQRARLDGRAGSIPIDRAMQDVARTGIPDWPTRPYRAR